MPISSTPHDDQTEIARLRQAAFATNSVGKQPAHVSALLEVLWQSCQRDDVATLLREALPSVLTAIEADYVAVAWSDAARWSIEGEAGKRQPLPKELLAEVLNREASQSGRAWIACPLVPRKAAEGVLVAYAVKTTSEAAKTLDAVAAALAAGVASARVKERQRRRTEQLETILRVAAQWNQTHEVAPLLEQMAEAATRLLKADRASIFLWDKPNRVLVGKPALGVKGDELRIPDDAGIVGQV